MKLMGNSTTAASVRFLSRYTHWLHTQWPAGTVEKLPRVGENGATSLAGVRVGGDLAGIPLLKFAADTGVRAVRAIHDEHATQSAGGNEDLYDVAIVGAGVCGVAAAVEAAKLGLRFVLFEAAQPFATVRDYPRGKQIFTYPTAMTPQGDVQFTGTVKESLLTELESYLDVSGIKPLRERVQGIERTRDTLLLRCQSGASYRARRVLVAIGRSGEYRALGVEGETLDKVTHRLFDPAEYAGKPVLVVGGGDSAVESALALVQAGALVTLSYRRTGFSRVKPDNAQRIEALIASPSLAPGTLRVILGSTVERITAEAVELRLGSGETEQIINEHVFAMTGREPPLDFLKRSGIRVHGEWTAGTVAALGGIIALVIVLYHWQKGLWLQKAWNPSAIAAWVATLGGIFGDAYRVSGSFAHTLYGALSQPGFYYSLLYSVCVVVFGLRRIRRRNTPYIRLQTSVLAAVQVIPLFLLPWLILPWMGHNGVFDSGAGRWIADSLWPNAEYWRAFGLVLAWPLFVYNWFTEAPLWGWLILGALQTFVVIPLLIYLWGKGAYCGWICSCGALAETLGDDYRQNMPHGPFWNRLNMAGQAILAVSVVLMVMRVAGWLFPSSSWAALFTVLFSDMPVVNYKYLVDIWLAGILGLALYVHFSGRVWCRFFCPLAALMHIYARFSAFRIFSDKKKCISCNVCTAVCHQGIDVMSFANRGLPMLDPQCVRCSACVQDCPTGVLSFGRFGKNGRIITDTLHASQVRTREEVSESNGR